MATGGARRRRELAGGGGAVAIEGGAPGAGGARGPPGLSRQKEGPQGPAVRVARRGCLDRDRGQRSQVPARSLLGVPAPYLPTVRVGGRAGMEADGALDPRALERELREAVAADERRERENDAKLRAMRQRVPSYEEFRNIVLASHLKPLEKKDKMGKRRNVLWNPCAAQTKAPQASDVEIPQELDQLPGTSAEFYRDWRRCLKSGKEKYQFLLELGGKALGRIFQADLGFGLLGEFLTVLAENVCHEDRDAILQILQSLSGTKRFGLNVDLLSESEKESSRDLFRKLQSMSRDYWTAGRPSSSAGCEAGREAHLMDTSLQKEAEEERIVMELMKCYQVN